MTLQLGEQAGVWWILRGRRGLSERLTVDDRLTRFRVSIRDRVRWALGAPLRDTLVDRARRKP